MKKRRFIGVKLTAALLSAVIALQMPVQTIKASAAAKTQYFSELVISYGKDDNEAKDWLTNNGYKVLNQNLNEGGEGGTEWLSWAGLASEKRSVFLGYKTTDNADEAITDMKIMNMNGGYSYQAYEKVLEETRLEKENFLSDLMAALREYRANYAKAEGTVGRLKAQLAHDNLNKLRDDDSGQLMGDLLLNSLRTEDEAAWEADPTQHADMVTIMMQGNTACVSQIMQNLLFAADEEDTPFLRRALAKGSIDPEKSNFDVFFAQFMEDHPGWSEDDAIQNLRANYDDDAKIFASLLPGLKNYLSNYVLSDLSIEASKEEVEQYFETHEFERAGAWAGAASLYSTLSSTIYGNETLSDFLVYDENDYMSDTALLPGYEEFGLVQRAMLYPLIAEMSPAQRALLEYASADTLLTMGLMDADTWAFTNATMLDEKFGTSQYEPCSVYVQIDREDFKVGDIAVTNAAQGKAASLGEPVDEGLFGTGISGLSAGLFVGGIAATVAGVAVAVKGHTLLLEATPPFIVEDGLIVWSDTASCSIVDAARLLPSEVDDALDMVDRLNEMIALDIRQLDISNHTKDELVKLYEDIVTDNIQNVSEFSNFNEQKYSKFMPVLDKEKGTITLSNGEMYDMNKAEKLDEVRENLVLTERTKSPNKDIALAAQKEQANLTVSYSVSSADVSKDFKKIIDLTDPDSEDGEKLFTTWLKGEDLDENLSVYDLTDDQFNDYVSYVYSYDDVFEYSHVSQPSDLANWRRAQAANMKAQSHNGALSLENNGVNSASKEGKIRDASEINTTAATFWKWFGVGMAFAGLAMATYSAYSAIQDMNKYYHMEMLPIPRKMIDLGYYEDGSTCYVKYDCVKCNRAEVGMGNETLGDRGDLNGDVMKQWLALYSTKDARAGEPIKAGFTKKTGTTALPVGKVPLAFFGFDYAVNMTDTRFTYNDKLKGIYLYYQGGANGAYTGTVTSGNTLVVTGVLSALGGAGICALLMKTVGKKRKETAAQ